MNETNWADFFLGATMMSLFFLAVMLLPHHIDPCPTPISEVIDIYTLPSGETCTVRRIDRDGREYLTCHNPINVRVPQ